MPANCPAPLAPAVCLWKSFRSKPNAIPVKMRIPDDSDQHSCVIAITIPG